MSNEIKSQLLNAALPHVAFDGWSETTFQAACRDADVDGVIARAVCPRGAVDLAVAFHQRGDAEMLERYQSLGTADLRYSEKVSALVRSRFEVIEDKEAVRRGVTLFALPAYALDGTQLIWGTADAIWTALGDTSDDVNWYTKRATLSAVYSSTVLFWLGDTSEEYQDTWAFLDRRIADVMQFEAFKARLRKSPVLSQLTTGPNWLMGQIKAPDPARGAGLPGRWGSR